MGDSDAGWLSIFGFIVVIGVIIIAGWIAYPYFTGHQYAGAVTKITTLEIEGRGLHVIQLKEYPGTWIVAPSGFHEGDYVMVGGYSVSTLVGTLVIGTDNIKNLDVSARVTVYTTAPLFLGLVLIAGGIIGYVVSVVVLGLFFTGSGFYIVLRWFWDARKSPAELSARLLQAGGLGVLLFGILFNHPMDIIGLLLVFSSFPIIIYARRRDKVFTSYFARLLVIFGSWLGSLPLVGLTWITILNNLRSTPQDPFPALIACIPFYVWLISLPLALEKFHSRYGKFQSRYGECMLCHSRHLKTDLFKCELCGETFCREHVMVENHNCKYKNAQAGKPKENIPNQPDPETGSEKSAQKHKESWWYGER